jgi:hypothetical protein
MEEKADRLLAARYTGGAKAPPTPTSVTDEDVEWAEESLAHPDAASRLCKGAQIAVGTTPDGPRAISVLLYPPPSDERSGGVRAGLGGLEGAAQPARV